MKVSFFLTRPTADTETSIYARICYAGYKFKYYTPESIFSKFWNKETQRAKETKKYIEYPEFNARLNNIEASIKTVYRKYINDNAGISPNPQTLKDLLNNKIRKIEPAETKKSDFLLFLNDIITHTKNGTRLNHKTGKPISPNTLKTYITTHKHLASFQSLHKAPIAFTGIDIDFYTRYTEYLMKALKLSANSVGKHVQIIKLVMNEATERGLTTNLAYKSKRFITIREKSDNIYLNESEIAEIERLDLSGNTRLDKVRDLFVIGCYTGLRFSDYSILKPELIKDGFIETTQTKTQDPVVIPIHTSVRRIIDKYAGKLPPAISNQKTNNYLKEIGQMVTSLNMPFIKTRTKGGEKVTGKADGSDYKKYDLLTSHTARRSFATNEYLAGTPTLTIMAITGHRTEKAFLRYIKLTPNEHAKLLKLHWEKRNQLKAV